MMDDYSADMTDRRNEAAIVIQNALYWHPLERMEYQLQYEERIAATEIQHWARQCMQRMRELDARAKENLRIRQENFKLDRKAKFEAQQQQQQRMHDYKLKSKRSVPPKKEPKTTAPVKTVSSHLVAPKVKRSERELLAVTQQHLLNEARRKKSIGYILNPEVVDKRKELAKKAQNRPSDERIRRGREDVEQEELQKFGTIASARPVGTTSSFQGQLRQQPSADKIQRNVYRSNADMRNPDGSIRGFNKKGTALKSQRKHLPPAPAAAPPAPAPAPDDPALPVSALEPTQLDHTQKIDVQEECEAIATEGHQLMQESMHPQSYVPEILDPVQELQLGKQLDFHHKQDQHRQQQQQQYQQHQHHQQQQYQHQHHEQHGKSRNPIDRDDTQEPYSALDDYRQSLQQNKQYGQQQHVNVHGHYPDHLYAQQIQYPYTHQSQQHYQQNIHYPPGNLGVYFAPHPHAQYGTPQSLLPYQQQQHHQHHQYQQQQYQLQQHQHHHQQYYHPYEQHQQPYLQSHNQQHHVPPGSQNEQGVEEEKGVDTPEGSSVVEEDLPASLPVMDRISMLSALSPEAAINVVLGKIAPSSGEDMLDVVQKALQKAQMALKEDLNPKPQLPEMVHQHSDQLCDKPLQRDPVAENAAFPPHNYEHQTQQESQQQVQQQALMHQSGAYSSPEPTRLERSVHLDVELNKTSPASVNALGSDIGTLYSTNPPLPRTAGAHLELQREMYEKKTSESVHSAAKKAALSSPIKPAAPPDIEGAIHLHGIEHTVSKALELAVRGHDTHHQFVHATHQDAPVAEPAPVPLTAEEIEQQHQKRIEQHRADYQRMHAYEKDAPVAEPAPVPLTAEEIEQQHQKRIEQHRTDYMHMHGEIDKKINAPVDTNGDVVLHGHHHEVSKILEKAVSGKGHHNLMHSKHLAEILTVDAPHHEHHTVPQKPKPKKPLQKKSPRAPDAIQSVLNSNASRNSIGNISAKSSHHHVDPNVAVRLLVGAKPKATDSALSLASFASESQSIPFSVNPRSQQALALGSPEESASTVGNGRKKRVYKDAIQAEHARREKLARQLQKETERHKVAMQRLPVPKVPVPQINHNALLNKGIIGGLRDQQAIRGSKGARKSEILRNEEELMRAAQLKKAVQNTYDEKTGLFGNNDVAIREHRNDNYQAEKLLREMEKQTKLIEEKKGKLKGGDLLKEQLREQTRETEGVAASLAQQQMNLVPKAPTSSKPSSQATRKPKPKPSLFQSQSQPQPQRVPETGLIRNLIGGVGSFFGYHRHYDDPEGVQPGPIKQAEDAERRANNEGILHVGNVGASNWGFRGVGAGDEGGGSVEEHRLGEAVIISRQ